MLKHLLQRVPEFSHQIGCCNGGASADSSHAVHQYISLFTNWLNKLVSLLEMLAQVVGRDVICGKVEVVTDFLFAEVDVGSPCDG